jgi:hypothetical protein
MVKVISKLFNIVKSIIFVYRFSYNRINPNFSNSLVFIVLRYYVCQRHIVLLLWNVVPLVIQISWSMKKLWTVDTKLFYIPYNRPRFCQVIQNHLIYKEHCWLFKSPSVNLCPCTCRKTIYSFFNQISQ